jgi:hypothetical protein
MSSQVLLLPSRREGTLRHRLGAWWAGAELDRRIADGADPGTDPLLRRRADRLVTPAFCARLAAGLEGVVATVDEPKTPFTAAVPVRRAAVRGARPELLALAEDLRSMRAPRPRGVAMAERLITDPYSPLYIATSSEEVAGAALAAARWLR